MKVKEDSLCLHLQSRAMVKTRLWYAPEWHQMTPTKYC